MVTVQQKEDLARLVRQINPGSEETEEFLTLIDTLFSNSAINDLNVIGGTQVQRTSVDFVKNSNDTLSDVGLETSSLAINTVYRVEMTLLMTTPTTTPDIKLKFTGPGSATFSWGLKDDTPGATNSNNVSDERAVPLALSTTIIRIEGILVVVGSIGTLKLQAAQNTSTAEDTKILTNSAMVVTRIA